MSNVDSRVDSSTRQAPSRPGRAAPRLIAGGLMVGAVAVTVSACGGSSSSPAAGSSSSAASTPKTVNVAMVGKIDADAGPKGTFTSKEHWPAMAPSEVKVQKGDKVVLTIKEYDDAVTELPAGSPYHPVTGGTETVDGKAVTTVSNADIAHTFTIAKLGINAPLPKAPEGGVATVVFTFTADKTGTFTWQCFTPCAIDPAGMGGAMVTDGWMRGHLIVT